MLTTLCAGIHPNRVLPVVLDCGTDNEDLLNDPLYLGLRHKRVRGDKYDEFVDTFVQSARKLYPKAYIHFEDFGLPNGILCPLPAPQQTSDLLTLCNKPAVSWRNTAPKFPASTTTSREQAA